MLQTDSNLLKGKFGTLEKDAGNLKQITQSMTEGADKLFERV